MDPNQPITIKDATFWTCLKILVQILHGTRMDMTNWSHMVSPYVGVLMDSVEESYGWRFQEQTMTQQWLQDSTLKR